MKSKTNTLQLGLGLGNEMVVDLFAGAGGTSTGVAAALGRPVDVAINHSPKAIALHKANHPHTRHYISDVWEVDPDEATRGLPVGLLHASSDCRHFSKASGNAKKDKRIRSLTWVILRWAYKCQPRVISAENVEEIATWGPLDANGKPIKSKAGIYYDGFIKMLSTGVPADHPAIEDALDALDGSVPREALIRGFGYQLETRELRAQYYGAATIRKRWYLLARRDNRPIVWPAATHGPGTKRRFRLASDIVDWSEPMGSIFMSPLEARAWGLKVKRHTPRRPLAQKTLDRIARGLKKYVIESDKPFVVDLSEHQHAGGMTHVTHAGGNRSRSLREPVPTITGANRGELALFEADLAPHSTPFIVRPSHGDDGRIRCHPVTEPLGAVTGTNEFGLVQTTAVPSKASGHVLKFRGKSQGTPFSDPLPTITGGGDGEGRPAAAAHALGVCTAFLAQHNTGVIGRPIDQPVSTILNTGSHQAVVTATTRPLASGYIVPRYGERAGQEPRCRSLKQPLSTITPNSNEGNLVVPIIDRQFGNSAGAPVSEPTGTITGINKTALVAASVTNFYSSNTAGGSGHLDKPLGAITAQGQHQGLITTTLDDDTTSRREAVKDFLQPYFPDVHRDNLGVVVIDGVRHEICDIRMRMFTPRELYRASGFSDKYNIDITYDGKKLPKSDQIRGVGNAVVPHVIFNIVLANFTHEREYLDPIENLPDIEYLLMEAEDEVTEAQALLEVA